MYLVFENETNINAAMELLESDYRFQRVDGYWITIAPEVIPPGLPTYTLEDELLAWYPEDSKQYKYLAKKLKDDLGVKIIVSQEKMDDIRKIFVDDNAIYEVNNSNQCLKIVEALHNVELLMKYGFLEEALIELQGMKINEPFITVDKIVEAQNIMLAD